MLERVLTPYAKGESFMPSNLGDQTTNEKTQDILPNENAKVNSTFANRNKTTQEYVFSDDDSRVKVKDGEDQNHKGQRTHSTTKNEVRTRKHIKRKAA